MSDPSAVEPVETARLTVPPGGEASVQLLLKLQPKLLRGQLQLIGKADERTIRELLARYDLTVVALSDVVAPVDRFEGTVDLDPDEATKRVIEPKRIELSPAAPLAPLMNDPHSTPPPNNRRQQAAAILIAIIALLNTLLLLLK